MADNITAQVGSLYLLRWQAPTDYQVTNSFAIAKTAADGTVSVDTRTHDVAGPTPKVASKGDETITITVTKDGKPYGFRENMPDPTYETKKSDKNNSYLLFTFKFGASAVGVFVFTVTCPAPTNKVITKQVTVSAGKGVVTDKRQAILDVVNRWMPSSVLVPNPPADATPEELKRADWTQTRIPGLLELSGWTATTVTKAQATKKAGGLVTTSCGDVLAKVLKLWGVDFDGDSKMSTRAFGIRDDGAYQDKDGHWFNKKGKPPLGAITHGYYRKATDAFATSPPELPTPGDIIVLRNGDTLQASGVGHVGVIVSVSDEIWVTADGGGGSLDAGDQTASKSERPVSWTAPDSKYPKGIPVLASPTDGKKKLLDGWVILDKIPNPLYDADGKKL